VNWRHTAEALQLAEYELALHFGVTSHAGEAEVVCGEGTIGCGGVHEEHKCSVPPKIGAKRTAEEATAAKVDFDALFAGLKGPDRAYTEDEARERLTYLLEQGLHHLGACHPLRTLTGRCTHPGALTACQS
jgi:hypothetical protein